MLSARSHPLGRQSEPRGLLAPVRGEPGLRRPQQRGSGAEEAEALRAVGQKQGPWPVLPEPLPSHLPAGRALR